MKNTGLIFIIALIMFINAVIASQNNILSIYLTVFENDTVVQEEIKLTFGSPLLLSSEKGDYSLKVSDGDGEIIYSRDFDINFVIFSDPPYKTDNGAVYDKIPYSNTMDTVHLYRNDRLIFSHRLIFCNNNGSCESEIGENYSNCRLDCPAKSRCLSACRSD